MLTSMLALAAVLAGTVSTPTSNDTVFTDRLGGASEASQTVVVTARTGESEPAVPAGQSATQPPYRCSMAPDATFNATPTDREQSGGAGDGSWYRWTCTGETDRLGMVFAPLTGVEHWLPNRPAATPRAVALDAVKTIHLSMPALNMSPRSDALQWVNFPLFLWLDGATWHPLSATASVPGVQVTATAAPYSVTWDMGDGSSVTCKGPGTPFTRATPAASKSPDCGHVYQRSSAAESGGTFRINATERWRVSWQGDGQSGELPDLSASVSTAVRVAESQALVTTAH